MHPGFRSGRASLQGSPCDGSRNCVDSGDPAADIGDEFDGVVTGAPPKGTWARIFDPPVEGRVEQGAAGLDVGDRVRVKLIHTDPERGFIDFTRMGR
jgi:RNase II-type exonuclease C-terminal S1 domain